MASLLDQSTQPNQSTVVSLLEEKEMKYGVVESLLLLLLLLLLLPLLLPLLLLPLLLLIWLLSL
jgi:hypothetical protein